MPMHFNRASPRDGPRLAAIGARAAAPSVSGVPAAAPLSVDAPAPVSDSTPTVPRDRSRALDADDHGPFASAEEIETAFKRNRPALLRYLYAWTGRVQDAEDLLGDTFVQAWRYRGRIASPDAWIFTVARRCATRLLIRRRREGEVDEIEHDGDGAKDIAAGAVAPRTDALDATAPEMVVLFALRAADREILELHGREGRPMCEVAMILGIDEPAAWQRWQRARKRYFALLVAVGIHPPEGWRRPRRASRGSTRPEADGAAPGSTDS